MAAAGFEAKFRVIFVLVKAASMVVGLIGTLIGLMATTGLVTDRLWLRLTVAIIVALVVPLVIADRMLPANDPTSARGLPTDILAVVWLGCALTFTALAGMATRGLLVREGDRLVADGSPLVARVAYAMARVPVRFPPPPAPTTSASASAPSASASAPPANAAASAHDAAPSVEDAATAFDAPAEAASSRDKTERTPADLFKQVSPSVVSISVKQKAGAEGGGTGFLIDREGVIATNHHVVDEATAIRIKFIAGAKYTSAELLVDDASLDLALLKIDFAAADAGPAPDVKPLELGDSEAVQVGERVISIGNPLGLEHTLTDGLVSARRVLEGKQWIQMSAPVSPGNSGGPLFNMRGEVIGVTTAQLGFFARGQNLNLAIPVNVLKGLIKPSYPGRRKIGDDSTSSSVW
ncbi:MAG: trypsin-like peptidase domain-containing protein [Deltaproteobacteria bacterium]|nr:trypsin-like peptidase domain-containing protein [Deltaproteobacteria bacterium]